MIPPYATIELDDILLLVVEICSQHLARVESVVAPAEASSTSSKSSVADIIGRGEAHDACLRVEARTHKTRGISVLGAYAYVGIGEETLVHALLQSKVEHCLLVSVVDAGHPCQVALLVVGLYFLNDGCRKVLHGGLGVTRHKLLAVDKDFLHLLAVDGNLSVVVDLRSRQPLHQFLYGGAFGRAVCRTIIYKGVFLHRNLQCLCRYLCFLEHDGIGSHLDSPHGEVVVLLHHEFLDGRDIAYAGDFQQVGPTLGSGYGELALLVGNSAGNERTVGGKQLHCGLYHWLLGFLVYKATRDSSVLRHRRHCHDSHQRQK